MSWRHERTSGVSSAFMIVLVVWAVWAETCDDLQCLNSNPCQTLLHPGDNSTEVRCVCGGRWAGRRCQLPIRLVPKTVTSSQAKLTVEVLTSSSHDVARSPGSSAMSLVSGKDEEEGEGEVRLNYTLVYWRRNDTMTSLALDASFLTSGEISCVLLHNKKSRTPVLGGLRPSTRYTICVESGFVDSCVLSSFTDSLPSIPSSSSSSSSSSTLISEWPSNCVTIYTPSPSPTVSFTLTHPSTVTLVAVGSVLVLVLLVIVLVVFLLWRQNLAFRMLLDSACHRFCCCCSCCTACRGGPDDSQDRSRLSQPGAASTSPSSKLPRTVFLDDNACPERSPKKSLFRRAWRKKKPKSSTYTSAKMLLGPPPPAPSSLTHQAFSAGAAGEASPLSFDIEGEEGEEDSVFDNSLPEPPAAVAALPTLRNKPRHKLSRKRRGYVTYSTRKDKNIRLTTVLESTTGDEDEFEDDVLGCGHSSI